jgi:hypothetical protein
MEIDDRILDQFCDLNKSVLFPLQDSAVPPFPQIIGYDYINSIDFHK